MTNTIDTNSGGDEIACCLLLKQKIRHERKMASLRKAAKVFYEKHKEQCRANRRAYYAKQKLSKKQQAAVDLENGCLTIKDFIIPRKNTLPKKDIVKVENSVSVETLEQLGEVG